MGATFDKNQVLAQGYLDWCTTERTEWEANMVGQLLADDVRIVDAELNEDSAAKPPCSRSWRT
jgi:hypothetical protein